MRQSPPRAKTSIDRYRASLRNREPLKPEAERQLARDWRAGDERAGHELISASLPFVIRTARMYLRWGIPLEDLIQQGNLGLLKAAERFDPDQGCRLVTYATYWIRAEIRAYVVRHYRIVRLGSTRTERRAIRAYRRERIANHKELAELSGMPEKRAAMLLPLLMQCDSSLDTQYGSHSPAITRLRDDVKTAGEQLVHHHRIVAVRKAMDVAMKVLSDRERRIIELRILGDDPPTLKAIGQEMGVSKERVRQLEVRARGKLAEQLSQFRPAE
jgi:RNA polymerase sigma-32 factor